MANIISRKKCYIIGKPTNLPANVMDISFDDITKKIEQLSNQFEILAADGSPAMAAATIRSRPRSTKSGLDSLVVEMTPEVKDKLESDLQGSVFIEEDEPLTPIEADIQSPHRSLNFSANTTTEKLRLRIVVRGPNGEPINNARVSVSGLLWVDHGISNEDGQVTVSLLGETEDSISLIEVKPAHTYWSISIARPMVFANQDNEVMLKKLGQTSSTSGGVDERQLHGWGQKAMGLPSSSLGQEAVKIAVIDSGLFANHSDLTPAEGFDFGTTSNAAGTWTNDGSGHGTHVAGICSAQNNQFGILGFAPNAQLVGLRVFPNATNSKLISALDWCIDNDVDVINMSLGGKSSSQAVQQRLQACRDNGILPVAAAGNNGGSVLFPAAFPEVLAVAAIGRFDSFPADSSHQQYVGDNPITSGDFFVPTFTCRGPEVNVCAPGVAIVSSVPENGYAAWDGTSMACPHVTGFAGRLLQSSERLREMPRTAARSQSLFNEIISHCQLLDGLPAETQGKGLPKFPSSKDTEPEIDASIIRLKELLSSAIEIVEREMEDADK